MTNSVIHIDEQKCNLCYSCVRVCPVKAIEVKVNTDYARVIPNRCIDCGNCIEVCPDLAITYVDGKNIVKDIIANHKNNAVLLDPSIAAEFSDIMDYRRFVNMIKNIGFDKVYEISFGVDIIANEYKKLLEHFNGKYYISANCPVIVSYISKYKPSLIENVVPIDNPVIATAKIVKNICGANCKTVYIGSCIAIKKYNTSDVSNKYLDASLTFKELRELFEEFNISEATIEYSDFELPKGRKGALYPISNGILVAADIDESLLNTPLFTVDGNTMSIQAVNEFESNSVSIKKHLNVFHCNGCINGKGISSNSKALLSKSQVIEYTKKRLEKTDVKQWEKDIKEYSEIDYSTQHIADDQQLPQPSEEKIQDILKLIGKDFHNQEIGCSLCGYNSCYNFAISVVQGLSKTEMCNSFALRSKQEYIKSLKTANDRLSKAREALRESEQKSRLDQQKSKEASETINSMMQKLNSGVVIVDDKLRVIQSNNSFINLLGEDARMINEVIPGLVGADLKTLLPIAFYKLFIYILNKEEESLTRDVYLGENLINVSVFSIKSGKIAGAIIRDMYTPEVRKEEVVKRVEEVIEKNLEVVQQIAFLLGESASETEQRLNSIIEFYKSKKT